MKVDVIEIPFTAVTEDGNVAVLNVQNFDRWAIGVDVTSVTGSPTSFYFEVHPSLTVADGTEFHSADSLKSSDLTVAGKYMLGRMGTTPSWPVKDNAFALLHVHAHFNAGSTPTVSGKVVLWRTEK